MTIIPDHLAAACRGVPERMAWLDQLPRGIEELQRRWSLTLQPGSEGEASCSWIAPAVRKDGTRAMLKIGMPHLEAVDEIAGLRFWNGDPTVHLLAADARFNAMLLERCDPGTSLRRLPESEQDVIVAELLRRLWRTPSSPHEFRPLSVMLASWAEETLAACAEWTDAGLVRAGLALFEQLGEPSASDVLLATDLHAGNVLRAQRAPWLVIDPKPFIGDRAYDATQHLLNCKGRMSSAPYDTIVRFADLLGVDAERVRLWMFARLVAEPRATWRDDSGGLARGLM